MIIDQHYLDPSKDDVYTNSSQAEAAIDKIDRIKVLEKVGKLFNVCYTLSCEWAVSSEKVPSNMCKMRRYRLSCVRLNYHPCFCSSLIYFLVHHNLFITLLLGSIA